MNTFHTNNVLVSSSPRLARSPSPLLWPAGQCCHRLLCWPGWALVQKHGQCALGSCLAVRRPATGSSQNGAAAPWPALPGRQRGRVAPGVAPALQLSPSFSSLLPQEQNGLWPLPASPQRGPDPLQATAGRSGPQPGGALTRQPTSWTRKWPLCPSLGPPAAAPPRNCQPVAGWFDMPSLLGDNHCHCGPAPDRVQAITHELADL